MAFGRPGGGGAGFGKQGAAHLGGAQPWQTTFNAYKSYLAGFNSANNPHALPAMASPPTITTTTTDVSATYPKSLVFATASDVANSILIENGVPTLTASVFEQPYAATISSGVVQKVASRQSVNLVNADAVAIYVLGTTAAYRFLCNDQYVDFTGTVPAATSGTGSNYIILTFGSNFTGKFTVEQQQGGGLRRIHIKNAASFGSKPSKKPFRIIFPGDSFSASTGATAFGDGYTIIAGDYLGCEPCPDGVGSTGYVNDAGATRYTLGQRLSVDVLSTGPWDLIFPAMGINDINLSGVQAAAASVFDRVRQAYPAGLIFPIGPWDASAPSAPSAGYGTVKAAIQAAMAGRGGFYFLDPQGVSYTHSDATHPDTPGHATLAAWLVAQVRASMGLS